MILVVFISLREKKFPIKRKDDSQNNTECGNWRRQQSVLGYRIELQSMNIARIGFRISIDYGMLSVFFSLFLKNNIYCSFLFRFYHFMLYRGHITYFLNLTDFWIERKLTQQVLFTPESNLDNGI
jgi:hypothetical protein